MKLKTFFDTQNQERKMEIFGVRRPIIKLTMAGLIRDHCPRRVQQQLDQQRAAESTLRDGNCSSSVSKNNFLVQLDKFLAFFA